LIDFFGHRHAGLLLCEHPQITGKPAMTDPSAERRPTTGSSELDNALRSGPFDVALQLAIERSELTLDRLEYRLRARGHEIGRSTLSYWQKGRRRPERPASLAALTTLEEILNVPPGALSSLLGPRKPRGRWIGYRGTVLDWSELMAGPAEAVRMVQIETRRSAERLSEVMLSERVTVSRDRRFATEAFQYLSRARQNNADRHLVLSVFDPGVDVSKIHTYGLQGCRTGRTRMVVEDRVFAHEMLFDRVLSEGASHVHEFALDLTDAYETDFTHEPAVEWGHAFRRTVALYLLTINFDPAALPVRCFHTRATRLSSPEQFVEDVLITPDGRMHLALQDVDPGVHFVRWEWE
jgi:hypothetical protein